MRLHLRPNGEYNQHLIAGVVIPKHGRETVVDHALDVFLVDDKDAPLRLSTKAYEHFRAEFGRALVAEPLDAMTEAEGDKRIAELELELRRADGVIEKLQKALEERARQFTAQIDGLKLQLEQKDAVIAKLDTRKKSAAEKAT